MPIHSLDPGGVERVGWNLAGAWQTAGNDVTIVLGRGSGIPAGIAGSPCVLTQPCPVSTARFETVWMISCLYRFLSRNRVDILFCPGNTYAVVGVFLRILLRDRCPPIVIKISNDLVRRDMGPMMHVLYGLWLRLQGVMFDGFVAMAPSMLAEIGATTGVGQSRMTAIVDPALCRERFARLASFTRHTSPWQTRYVAAGRLVSQKNFPLLINAFSQGAGPRDTLTIAGDGPERWALASLVDRLGLGDRVSLVGHLGSTDELLAGADAFVLSSDYEGLPAVVIEAMAAGLPVIATRCSAGVDFLLGGGRQGMLVPVGDQAALEDAFGSWRRSAFDPARARATASRFTIENAADAYLKVMWAIMTPHLNAPVRKSLLASHYEVMHG